MKRNSILALFLFNVFRMASRLHGSLVQLKEWKENHYVQGQGEVRHAVPPDHQVDREAFRRGFYPAQAWPRETSYS